MRKLRIPGYVMAVITSGLLLYVANNLLRWDVPFVTGEFSRTLWAVNLSLGASITGNTVLIVRDMGRFRHVMKGLLGLLALNAIYVLYTVFPFDLPLFMTGAVRMGLVVVMVGIGIRLVINMVMFTFKTSIGKE